MKIKQKIYELEDVLNKHVDDTLIEITKKAIQSIEEYLENKNNDRWLENYSEIKEIFYKSFIKTYSLTAEYIQKMYSEVADFNIDDIDDLTYREDGKVFDQRLLEHWKDTKKEIDDNNFYEGIKIIKIHLISKLEKILRTEVRHISNAVKKHKYPLGKAYILIIEGGCENCEGGEYPPDEDIPWPPYHPCCKCVAYWEEASEDDINDLDLELEE